MLLALTVLYGQCMSLCCWLLRQVVDYKITNAVGSYSVVFSMYEPTLLVLTVGCRLQNCQCCWFLQCRIVNELAYDVGSYDGL
jgi:hypothetical protein